MTPGPGIEPGTHWWKASALTTTPTLLPTILIFLSQKTSSSQATESQIIWFTKDKDFRKHVQASPHRSISNTFLSLYTMEAMSYLIYVLAFCISHILKLFYSYFIEITGPSTLDIYVA